MPQFIKSLVNALLCYTHYGNEWLSFSFVFLDFLGVWCWLSFGKIQPNLTTYYQLSNLFAISTKEEESGREKMTTPTHPCFRVTPLTWKTANTIIKRNMMCLAAAETLAFQWSTNQPMHFSHLRAQSNNWLFDMHDFVNIYISVKLSIIRNILKDLETIEKSFSGFFRLHYVLEDQRFRFCWNSHILHHNFYRHNSLSTFCKAPHSRE